MSPFALYDEGKIYIYDELAEIHVVADILAEILNNSTARIFRKKGCFLSNNCYNESITTKDKGQVAT